MKQLLSIAVLSGLLTALRMVSGFVIAKVVAIYAGPSGIAMLGQVQSLVAALNGFSSNQISQGIVRFTAENTGKGLLACSPWWKAATTLVFSALAVSALIVIGFSIPIAKWLFGIDGYTWVVILAVLVLPLNAANVFIGAVLNGRQEYKQYFLIGATATIVGLIAVTLSTIIFGIKGAIGSAAVNNAIAGGCAYFLVKNSEWAERSLWLGMATWKKIKAIRGYFYMGIVGALTGPVSLILIRNMIIENSSITDAGNWQAVWRISEAYLSVLTLAISTYYFPMLVKSVERKEILKHARQTAFFVVISAIFLAIIIFLLKEYIINILYSDKFHEAKKLFGLQLVGDVFRITSFVTASIFMAKGYVGTNMILEIAFSMSLVVLSYFLISKLGVEGANAAYAINYLGYLVVTTFLFFKIVNKPIQNL